MPSKRSKIKIETKESNALKRMRLATGMSLRQASKLTGINANMINFTEIGRATITKDYVDRIVAGFGFSGDDWNSFLNDEITVYEMRLECIANIKQMPPAQAQILYSFMKEFCFDC